MKGKREEGIEEKRNENSLSLYVQREEEEWRDGGSERKMLVIAAGSAREAEEREA